MDKDEAHQLAFEIMQNILHSHGETFKHIKDLKSYQKNKILYVIERTILDYFNKIKT